MSWMTCLIIMLFTPTLHAQIRHGASFLRLMPGPRQQGLASSSTAVLDEHYTVYANPGAAGFMREWQWSASYSRWIADVYSASVFYGQRMRLPWSAQTRVGLGVAYQGVPEFDSSQRLTPQASASDVLFAVSFGQPFRLGQHQFAFGVNAKYLMSKLAQYEANTWMTDLGVLYRTKRFGLLRSGGILEYGIFSAGVALTQLGPALQFIASETPLPRTWRAGLAFNAGSHAGLQMQLALDYHRTLQERGEMSFGTEFSWSQIVSVRGGYDFENRLISPIAFGVSLRLDDHKMPLHNALPGRNNALRFDLAAAEDNLLFSRPYRGGITHHPIGPERFHWGAPAYGAVIESDSVTLQWEATRDPDLYDDAQFLLLVDRDSTALAQTVALAEREPATFFHQKSAKTFFVQQPLTRTHYLATPLRSGKYFWSVLAYDTEQHVRVIGTARQRLNMFQIVAPEAEIEAITFEYHPWITEDDYQGKIHVTVKNTGARKIAELTLAVHDSAAAFTPLASKSGRVHEGAPTRQTLGRLVLVDLLPGESRTLTFDWHTLQSGWHHLVAVLDDERRVFKASAARQRDAQFCTIPKGRFFTGDTVAAFTLSRFAYEVPFIPEVCFAPGSAQVTREYVSEWVLEPPLQTLAQRLRAHAEASITLQGYSDPNSEEHEVALANARAEAVRTALLQLGVRAEQMRVLPGQILQERRTPAKPEDARWVMQERRYVQIATAAVHESILFDLVAFDDIETLVQPVTFLAAIQSASPLRTGELLFATAAAQERVALNGLLHEGGLQGELQWRAKADSSSAWQNQSGTYQLTTTDSLQRGFRTAPRETFLAATPQLRAQRVAWPIRFNVTAPMYDFYWPKLFKHINYMLLQPKMRMRFSGHACAIGPEAINLRLSQRRAEEFQQSFLQYARAQYADSFQKIMARIDAAKGFGETRPMAIERLNGDQIIKGDNESPLGRKLNRRIEVEFYYP